MQKLTVISLSFLLIYAITGSNLSNALSAENLLTEARNLFYQSIEDKDKIEPAINLFRQLHNQQEAYQGRALTYIGVLYALKGKHSFWPYNKLKWVMKGLKLMDQGISKSPDDIEALFIHSSTCYYLPFFFERGDDAQHNFKRIVALLPSHKHQYDPVLISNAIQFIELHAKLNEEEINTINKLKSDLTQK